MGVRDGVSDFELEVQAVFTGRSNELQMLWTNWNKFRIFGVFGLRCVGKSRLVGQFITRHLENEHVVFTDCRFFRDMISIHTNICMNLKIETMVQDLEQELWIPKIVDAIQRKENTMFVFVFDNTEDIQEQSQENCDLFLKLCSHLIKKCRNVNIIITSTTRVQFAQLQRVYYCHEVLPLNGDDSLELLQSELKGSGIKLGEYSKTIITLTEGIPIVILMVASELKEDSGMITPEDMVDLLVKERLKTLSREYYPKEDRIADVYQKFINRLSKFYQHRLAALSFIPGSFTAKESQQMLGYPTEASVKSEFIVPVRRRHFLHYYQDTKRLSMQGFLMECIRICNTVEKLPDIRARFVHTFSQVMTNIAKDLDTSKHFQVMAELSLELPNLQKLMKEVEYIQADTYKFFIRMATECVSVIESYLIGEADTFYECCLKAADMYGEDLDKAAINIAVGSFCTTVKANYAQGCHKLEAAINILKKRGQRSLELATAHDRLGWNLMYQGRYLDAISHFDESLSISSTSGPGFQIIALESMGNKGKVLVHLGRFRDAEMYLLPTLERRQKLQGDDHPHVGNILNTIGLMYDRKKDVENTLTYFVRSLDIKKRSSAPDLSIASSLTNVARIFKSVKRIKEAHMLLDEVEEILDKQKVSPGNHFGYLYESRALVYMKEGNLEQARQMIEKAVEKQRCLSADSPQYLETLYNKAIICRAQRKYKTCVKTAKQALQIQETLKNVSTRLLFVKDCLDCLVVGYKELADDFNHKRVLRSLESELMRIERELDESNEADHHNIKIALKDVQSKLDY